MASLKPTTLQGALTALGAVAALACLAGPVPASARGHGGGHAGGGQGSGGFHFRGAAATSSRWRPAGYAFAAGTSRAGYGPLNGYPVGGPRHHHGSYAIFFFGPGWGFYPYDYLWTYPPAVSLVQPADINYVEKPELEEEEARSPHWYYCYEPAGYYPAVKECTGSWYPVAPIPAQPAGR